MKIRVPFLAIVASLLLTTVAAAPTALPASAPAVQSAATMAALPDPPKPVSCSLLPCPVTQPNTDRSPDNGVTRFEGGYENDYLWTNIWMLGQGRVLFEPGGSGFVLKDGSLGIKWAWYRYVAGPLTIKGHRLDAPAPPLRADFEKHNGPGFQPMYLIFPTPGCWEVTGRVNDESLTFVTLVERLGDGPNWRPDETS